MSEERLALSEKEKNQIIDSWELQLSDSGAKLYSCDAIIDAYLQGKNEGLAQGQKVLKKHFETNLKKSASATSVMFQLMSDKSVNPIDAYLKPISFDQFDILILISQEDFIKESISDIYNQSYALETSKNEDVFNISFSFINKSESFNESLLQSDGYLFRYSKP